MVLSLIQLLITACKKSQGSRDASKTQAIVACVCCAALSCFSGVKHCSVQNQSDDFGQKLMEVAYVILDCCNGDHTLRRAAGELVGYAALVGSDAFASRSAMNIPGLFRVLELTVYQMCSTSRYISSIGFIQSQLVYEFYLIAFASPQMHLKNLHRNSEYHWCPPPISLGFWGGLHFQTERRHVNAIQHI